MTTTSQSCSPFWELVGAGCGACSPAGSDVAAPGDSDADSVAPVSAAASSCGPASARSACAMTAPWLTLSPSATFMAVMVPSNGAGTSSVALSDSSVIRACSASIVSPSATSTSMISTASKSPMSGTLMSSAMNSSLNGLEPLLLQQEGA